MQSIEAVGSISIMVMQSPSNTWSSGSSRTIIQMIPRLGTYWCRRPRSRVNLGRLEGRALQPEQADGAEGGAVVDGGAVALEGGAVVAGAVAGVLVPAVMGVSGGEAEHGAVADDLGDDAGGGDGEGGGVPADTAAGRAVEGGGAVAVDEGEVGRGGEAGDGAAHGEHGGVEDVEAENLGDGGGADGDLRAGAAEEGCVGGVPRGRAQGLAVVDEGAEAAGHAIAEDDGTGDHGAGEGAAAHFIDAGDPAAMGAFKLVVGTHRVVRSASGPESGSGYSVAM